MGGRLANKVTIVTGAGSGIGRAITLRFAMEGAKILAVDMNGSEKGVAAEAEGEVVPYQCDVSRPDQVAGMVDYCRQRFERLDILCNNAGINLPLPKRLHEVSLEEWDKVFGINLRGAFVVLKHSLPLMLVSGGGAIVNTASIGGFRATPGSSAYMASKGGMVMLTRAAALEYAQDGIRVNAICPGVIASPMFDGAPPELLNKLVSQVPQGRLGKPEEVANLALFLASDEASHITGGMYLIDGGRSAG